LFFLLNNEFNCFVVHSAVSLIETSFFKPSDNSCRVPTQIV